MLAWLLSNLIDDSKHERKHESRSPHFLLSTPQWVVVVLRIVKATAFLMVMQICKKLDSETEWKKFDTFELRIWTQLLRVLWRRAWAAKRISQSVLDWIHGCKYMQHATCKYMLHVGAKNHIIWVCDNERKGWARKRIMIGMI